MADDSNGGRIAIKFGAPLSSSSHSSKSKLKPTPASSLGKRPRTHAFGGGGGGGGDSDSDDDGKKRGQHEAITGFGVNGAETERARGKEEAKKEYVIARQPNRDWRDEIRAQRGARRSNNLLPAEARAAAAQDGASGSSMDTAPADQDSGIQWGLTIKEKKPADAGTPSAAAADDDGGGGGGGGGKDMPIEAEPAQPPPPQSADDEAMDALLGKRPAKDTPKVIVTEDDAYTRDVSAAGATSTLADYDAMPVEEFGAALLRGMGWNGEPSSTSSKSNRARMPQRRQNRLGLGAKALNEAEDLGGWNQKGPGSGPGKKRPPKLADYRREEERRREGRVGGGGNVDGEDAFFGVGGFYDSTH
ncbi:hypothetical protein G3M48_004424 [Beauveria asiatica]|uniref:Pre-mRNA-splicing factor n=1 Tax=Beauveria asiatica TaxID=1069075 RepID=A0AAW0S730_9HYPO